MPVLSIRKKIVLTLGVVFATFFLAWAPYETFAQEGKEETPFEKTYKEYQTQITEYNNAHSDYVIKRSQYLRFKTLQSQQDAFDSTSKMLQERDDVNISYLKVLKEKLAEAVGVSDQTESELNVRLDDEIGWFTDHKSRIHTAGSLNDLVSDSNTARDRLTFESSLFYHVLSELSSGRITDFDERLNDIFGQLKKKMDEIKSEQRDEYRLPEEKLQQLDRWVFEAENRIQRSQDKHLEAKTEIVKLRNLANRPELVYSTTLLRLTEAQQFLRESGNYLIEIIRSIKTKD